MSRRVCSRNHPVKEGVCKQCLEDAQQERTEAPPPEPVEPPIIESKCDIFAQDEF